MEGGRAGRNARRSKAIGFLDGLIASTYRKGASRLPTISQLARQAGVGRDTMWKAVAALRAEGRLFAKPKAGITITETSRQPRQVVSGQTERHPGMQLRWQRLRSRIVSDILRGEHGPGARLPQAKALTQRYAVCHRTLRKALAGVVEDGYLSLDRGGFRVTAPALEGARNTVVLVCRNERGTDFPFRQPSRNVEVLRSLEAQCNQAGVHLLTVPFDFRKGRLVDPNGRRRVVLEGRMRDLVLGFVVWTRGMQSLGLPQFVLDLNSSGRPVAVLDENAFADWRSAPIPARLTRVFGLGLSERCSVGVARHLLQLGHRRIAYVGASPSDRRCQGLEQALRLASVDNEVLPLCPKWSPGSPAPVMNLDEFSRALLGEPATVAGSAPRVIGDEYRRYCERLRQAVERREASAWVALNDITALICLDYFRRSGIRVPEDISLVGFDDTAEACINGLTSYNFNIPGITQTMLWHILHPMSRRNLSGPVRMEEIEGFVTARSSTGPVADVLPPTPGCRRDRRGG